MRMRAKATTPITRTRSSSCFQPSRPQTAAAHLLRASATLNLRSARCGTLPCARIEYKVPRQTTYRDAGVNIDEAERAVAQIKRLAAKTVGENVVTGIGSFGAGFSLKGWRDPVLVSSADGVGTKLKIA